MKNILSYQKETKFTGEEIIQWAKYQIENKTSHIKEGEYILKHFNLISNKEYKIKTSYEGTGCGEIIHKPLILNVLNNAE